MKYMLAARNRRSLVELAARHALLAFDFDGTLAPIVADRNRARMRPATARLFRRACARFPCAVISGRSRGDVAGRLGGAAVRYVVGDHGADTGTARPRHEREMGAVLVRLRRLLDDQPGIDIEDKGASLAVHYRRAPVPAAAQQAIDRALRAIAPPVRLVPGKSVVNVVPADAPHKGDAFRRLLQVEGADGALYIGDDDTDEDVFGLPRPDRPLTVRIGRSSRSQAEYYLRSQAEIDRLLHVLVGSG